MLKIGKGNNAAGRFDIDGKLIRELRRRLGMTQVQLAEKMGVDQGTVSRWERGLEAPRPARRAELQNLLLRDENRRALLRSLAIIRQDYLPSTLLDSKLTLLEISSSGKRHFRDRGRDPDSIVGMRLERYAERMGTGPLHDQLLTSGLLSGDALLFRFVTNFKGRGHATVYEPLFEDGALIGLLNYVTANFELPANDEVSIELIEAVRADDPSNALILHKGTFADAAMRALRST